MLGVIFQNFRRLRRHFVWFFGACGAILCIIWTHLAPPSHFPAHPDGMLICLWGTSLSLWCLWSSSSTTELISTGLNTTDCAQIQWVELDWIQQACSYSALVATFASAIPLLFLICVVFSSVAPAALQSTTIFPERRLRRLIFFRFSWCFQTSSWKRISGQKEFPAKYFLGFAKKVERDSAKKRIFGF